MSAFTIAVAAPATTSPTESLLMALALRVSVQPVIFGGVSKLSCRNELCPVTLSVDQYN